MTEPLQVGQFAIVDHEPVDRGPNAGVFHGKGPLDDRAELYIVAEGTTPAGDAFTGHVVSTIGLAWTALDMSLTGALRELFKQAERNLRDWNQKSIAQHRVSIGLTCFGRRGDQAVIAQAGPSVVFHASAAGVEVYTPDDEHGGAVGEDGRAEPQLTRITFAHGDRLLLLSTSALEEVDEGLISGILALPPLKALPDLYQRLRHMRNLTALLVTNPDEGNGQAAEASAEFVIDATGAPGTPIIQAAAAPETPPGDSFQPSLFIQDPSHDALVSTRRQLMEMRPRRRVAPLLPEIADVVPEPLRRAAGESPVLRQALEQIPNTGLRRPTNSAVEWSGVMPRRTRPPASQPVESTPPPDGRRRRRESFSRGLVRDGVPERPMIAADDMPLVDELAEDSRVRAATLHAVSETIAGGAPATLNGGGALVRVRDNFGGRWRSNTRKTASGSLPPTWLIILVGLGILLALVGAVTVPSLLREDSARRYSELVDGAQQRLATARVQQDATERRKALTEAQAMLLEAKRDQEPSAEVQQLITSVAAAIAEMDAIQAPAVVDVVANLEQFGDKPLAVARLTIGDTQAYILDSTSGQVIAVTLANGDKKVVYGEDKDARRGRPVATTFVEPGDLGPALLIADTARNLWRYSTTNGVRPLVFAAPNNLSVTDMAIAGRDLFVLDSAQSAVFKFTGGDGGFLNPPLKIVEAPELASARRIVVDGGDVITSDANGIIRRYNGKLALELSEAGIDKRLVSPEPALPLVANGDLAVLDAPNDRIVVLRRDGAFDRQYRHKDLQSMSAFAIRNGVGYVFAGGKLRRISFNGN